MSDLTVQRDGVIFLLRSTSEAGAKWIDENLIIRWADEDGTHTGFERRDDAIVIDASIIEDMVENIETDNLTVSFQINRAQTNIRGHFNPVRFKLRARSRSRTLSS